MSKLNIVNMVKIGDAPEVNFEDLSPEQKKEVARKLNAQALEGIGYRKVEVEAPA